MPFTSAPPRHERVSEAEIDLRKCRLLFQNAGLAQAIVAINGGILVFVLGGLTPPVWAQAWLAAVFCVAGLRYAYARRFMRSNPTAAEAARWRKGAVAWTAGAGLLWAGGGIALMMADPEATRLLTALVLAGMVSGAVPILSSVPLAFGLYAAPVMLAIILTAALDAHDAHDWVLAVVSVLYLVAVLKSSRYFHDSLDRSIRAALDMQHMAEDLEQARRGAEASSNAKGQFLAMMSHEIRTPLNGILGMAQALQKPALADAQRADYARTILDSGRMLLVLLNDVLDFSKVDAGKLELKLGECAPCRIMEETAALFAQSAAAKQLNLQTACGIAPMARYLADPVRLRQMLSNLVSNAIKFTDRGFVRIEARELSREGDMVLLEFAVSDSGIGIRPEQQAALFEPFVQVDASDTRQFGGTGLGLSIVRLLAEMMGGSVGVDSQAGAGARFWFRVRVEVLTPPDGAPRDDAAPAAGTATQARTARRVLVVEDNQVNRKVIAAMLAKSGLSIEYAENGQMAVDAVSRGAFDLVLMDCQMPVMDGYAATAAIRTRERKSGRPRMPIVALTAGAFDEDRERCIAAGMDDFLAKPLHLAELDAMLAKWLTPDVAATI